jgi:Zn-dependent protease with chaperone function
MYSEIARNKQKTWVIMVLFVAFVGGLAWVGTYLLGGQPSMAIAVLIGAVVYALIMYFAGSRLSLAINGAREIQKSDNPRLFRIVENLALTDGLPMPRVYIMDDPAPNAFATGRNPKNAAVCATSGILELMNDTELEGVFAHEYLADATGAMTTRYPEGLASALEKLETNGRPLQKQNTSTAHLFFDNPLKSGGLANLFSTHPPLQDRIRRLREMNTHV